jgi:hypothetical protein
MKKYTSGPNDKIPWDLLWQEGVKLSIPELTLLSHLMSIDRGEKYGGVRVSIPQIREVTGLSRTTLYVAKRGLEQKGLIVVLGRRNAENVNAYDLAPIKRKIAGLRVGD